MAGLLIAAVIVGVLALYAAERVVKARRRARRLRVMSDRLQAAAARGEEQHEHRQAAAQASAALTSFMPAIKQPPLTVPDSGHRPTRSRRDRGGQQERTPGRAGRRGSR